MEDADPLPIEWKVYYTARENRNRAVRIMNNPLQKKIAVIGAGSRGTTLAILLADKGYHVKLWVYEPDLAEEMQKNRENKIYLPGHRLSDNIIVTSIIKDAVKDAGKLVFVVPSHVARGVIKELAHSLSDNIL